MLIHIAQLDLRGTDGTGKGHKGKEGKEMEMGKEGGETEEARFHTGFSFLIPSPGYKSREAVTKSIKLSQW